MYWLFGYPFYDFIIGSVVLEREKLGHLEYHPVQELLVVRAASGQVLHYLAFIEAQIQLDAVPEVFRPFSHCWLSQIQILITVYLFLLVLMF